MFNAFEKSSVPMVPKTPVPPIDLNELNGFLMYTQFRQCHLLWEKENAEKSDTETEKINSQRKEIA